MGTIENEVIREIQFAAHGPGLVPAARVRSWMSNPSLEVLGAVIQQLLRNSRKIEPPLSMSEICTAVQDYYRRCLTEDSQSNGYVLNRHIAGLELVAWFRNLWNDTAVPRDYLYS